MNFQSFGLLTEVKTLATLASKGPQWRDVTLFRFAAGFWRSRWANVRLSFGPFTLSFNSPQQKIYSYGKNFVAVKKNLDLRILRPQRRIIILCRRIMILETRILVLPPRLIILLRLKIMDFVTQTDATEVGNNFPCRKNVLQAMVSNPFM